jgi:hypothetical protein
MPQPGTDSRSVDLSPDFSNADFAHWRISWLSDESHPPSEEI